MLQESKATVAKDSKVKIYLVMPDDIKQGLTEIFEVHARTAQHQACSEMMVLLYTEIRQE